MGFCGWIHSGNVTHSNLTGTNRGLMSWWMVYMTSLSFISLVVMAILPTCTSLVHCPSSCSFISPVPYPFGAAEGCGFPGFQISNCTISPQWNLHLGDTVHTYYIRSIFPTPNSSNHSSVLSYGYGGAVLLSLPTPNTPFCNEVDPLSPLISAFSSSNMYAFEGASLSFYLQRYLLFNCSAGSLQAPSSGVFTISSQHCTNYLRRCNLSETDRCLEYSPDKELYLPALMSSYNCSSFRRFVIADDDDPVEDWIIGTQFAWGPVDYAEACSACQNTGGTCGYNTEDDGFLCYCSDNAYTTNCEVQKHSGSRTRIIVGATVSITSVLALAIISYYFLHQRPYRWRMFGERNELRLEGINQAPIEFPYGALAAATNYFKTEVGRGAFGKVYKGLLPDGNEVAVKVLDPSMSHSDEQFTNEVATIGNIHHINVARLFGFCFRKSRRILVYEYVCNGSLDKYLFPDEKSSHLSLLSWKQRFDIALGIARGLSYMHEECRKFIIHCDIKPQNILLDASYCPKISDFGLAKLLAREESRILTQARGTPGYVAPEFWSLGSGPLTAKFDVYSYGMVLLEIVRGRRSAYMLDSFALQECLDEEIGELSAVFVDKRIAQDADVEQARVCTLVALWCIQEDPAKRPTMGRVVEYLQGTIPIPSNPPCPFRKSKIHFEDLSCKEDDSTTLL